MRRICPAPSLTARRTRSNACRRPGNGLLGQAMTTTNITATLRLTLQEKLRDLRDEKKLTLTALSDATGIPTATLQRLEANEDSHASYTDVAALEKSQTLKKYRGRK